MWQEGSFAINGIKYHFCAKVYEEGSKYGINGGRVSKLAIYEWEPEGKQEILNYDRGWDIEPKTDTQKAALAHVLDLYA